MFKYTNHIIIGLLVVGLVLVSLFGQGTQETSDEKISVSGSKELTYEPDKAEVILEVVTLEDSAQEARDKNSDLADKVIDALQDYATVETESFNLNKREDYNPETGKREFVGYEVSHRLKATTEDISNVGKIIDTAVNQGANQVRRIKFTLSDEKQKDLKKEALAQATVNAKTKAKALAGALNVELGKVSSISESNFGYHPVYARDSLAAGKAETNIVPGEVSVEAQVSLAYNIKQ
ncbi:MAG: SIMPL domain-containing protein [Nanobdellota archaeon]